MHPPPSRQRPRLRAHDLALAVRPEVDAHADQVVDARVRALVQQQRAQAGERVDGQPRLDTPVHGRLGEGEQGKGPFPGEGEDAEQEVDDLEDRDGAHGGVEIGGEEVPEDLGPEETFEGGGDLVCGGMLDGYSVKWGRGRRGDVQRAAVRTMRRAQWFLMSLPMMVRWELRRSVGSFDRGRSRLDEVGIVQQSLASSS